MTRPAADNNPAVRVQVLADTFVYEGFVGLYPPGASLWDVLNNAQPFVQLTEVVLLDRAAGSTMAVPQVVLNKGAITHVVSLQAEAVSTVADQPPPAPSAPPAPPAPAIQQQVAPPPPPPPPPPPQAPPQAASTQPIPAPPPPAASFRQPEHAMGEITQPSPQVAAPQYPQIQHMQGEPSIGGLTQPFAPAPALMDDDDLDLDDEVLESQELLLDDLE